MDKMITQSDFMLKVHKMKIPTVKNYLNSNYKVSLFFKNMTHEFKLQNKACVIFLKTEKL